MLHRPTSRALIVIATLCTISVGRGPALADVLYGTSYVPTSSVVTLPSSGVFGTSYVVPTSYSSTYLPTSSVVSIGDVMTTSAAYVPTYRPFRFRLRRYVERTSFLTSPSYSLVEPTSYLVPSSYILPTSYVVPTTFARTSYFSPTSYVLDTGLMTTSASSICCETAPMAPARTATVAPSGAGTGDAGTTITSQPATAGGSSNERRPTGTVDDGMPSTVTPPVQAPAAPAPRPTAPVRTGSPLAEPPPLDPGTAPSSPQPATSPATGGNDVQIPPAGQIGTTPRTDETSFRKAQKPSYDVRNILRGRVVSFDSGRPEEGVSVIVSSRTRNFTDRPAMTNADGEFSVSLPDGDWTVMVKMPSGSVYPVGRDFLTASNGRIIDGAGRNVPSFLINR